MLASGNMTGTNTNTYYSSVISLCSMRTIVFLAELNNIDTRTGDISNTYLTAWTTEKIVFNAGTKFASFEHVSNLITTKTALYDLKISGTRLHSILSYDLTALAFVHSIGVFDIWIRNIGYYYFYVSSYWNDMIFLNKYPDHLYDSIRGKGFTIKEIPDLDYFLGGYFKRIKERKTNNKIRKWGSKTYVKRMMGNFKNTLGFYLSKQHTAMYPNYKPQLDTTQLWTATEKVQHWQWIGEVKWAVALGQKYIMYDTVVLSRYPLPPARATSPRFSIYMATSINSP